MGGGQIPWFLSDCSPRSLVPCKEDPKFPKNHDFSQMCSLVPRPFSQMLPCSQLNKAEYPPVPQNP